MTDDNDTQNAAAVAAPADGRGWSEQDYRTLVITFVGGLAANLGTVILVGAAIGFARYFRHLNSGNLVIWFSVATGPIAGSFLIVAGNAVRRGRPPRWLSFGRPGFWPRWSGLVFIGYGSVVTLETVMILTGLAAGVK